MEKHLPKLLTLLLLIISSSSLFAQTSTITFDASNYYKGTTSVTKDGVTITYTGFDSRNESYRINKDEYLIITSTIGNITKVVLTSPREKNDKYGLGSIDSKGFDVSSGAKRGTWTGNCNPVGLFSKTRLVLLNKIEVTVDKSKESNVDVTISSAGWATYVSKKAIDFTCSPVKAFTAKYDTKANTITLTKLEPEQIPANTPVVLKGNAGSYIFQQISSAKAVSNNDLKFKAEDFVVPEDKTYYGLAQKGEGCGFYPVEKGETVPAYKCYLLLSNPSAAKSFYPFNIATGIQSAVWRPIQQRGVRYNLAGQRVGDSYKGVVIENGKKIVVK